jgi:Raf kinase inhibitor-like YbhB/YbcL family protein
VQRFLKHLLWIIPAIVVLAIVSAVAYTAAARRADDRYHSSLQKSLIVESDGFENLQEMPAEYSCKGAAAQPQIRWSRVPDGTRSFALIASDWDVPSPHLRLASVTHWVLYNIPVDTTEIPKNSPDGFFDRKQIVRGLNMGRQPDYAAPCPPTGVHRYEFRVYALDVPQLQPTDRDASGVMQAMSGHILAYGELVGLRRP